MGLLMIGKLILASSSKIRKQLLNNANVPFISIEPNIDEDAVKLSLLAENYPPSDVADALAELKASKISSKHPDSLVLGCDQILEFNGAILEKPGSKTLAVEQLIKISGKKHTAHSAAVIYENRVPVWRFVGKADLILRNSSERYIFDYVSRNWDNIKSSVGGYQIEEEGCRLIQKISGDYFSVLGMPLLEIVNFLSIKGIIDG